MTISLKLCWQDDVSVSENEGKTVICAPQSRLTLSHVCPAVLTALHQLTPPGETEERLEATVLAGGSGESLARWFFHMEQFRRRGLLQRALHSDTGHMATLLPLVSSTESTKTRRMPLRADAVYQISRFAYLRRDGQQMVLESPLSHTRLILHDPCAVMIIASLSIASSLEQLESRIPQVPLEQVAALVALLVDAGMLDDSQLPESSTPASSFDSWEFHDLLFHSRSRRGRTNALSGATYRLIDQPPPAALHQFDGTGWIELYRPELNQLEQTDPPFAWVQNHRQSIRSYGTAPITVNQLGEILYRVARVTKQWTSQPSGSSMPIAMDFAARPYPSGGALYELEFYPVIRACQGLVGGFYVYDPIQHRLRLVAAKNSDVESLLDDAALSAGIEPSSVQVLLVLASQFRRIAWKYESIAYALTLKHVGVVYQTLYLAATAMGLAPCAIGCGDSDLFTRAAGTKYHVESSVGEFLLGSRT